MHYNYGLALLKLERLNDAYRELLAVYKAEPQSTDYLWALGSVLIAQERWGEADKCYEELVNRDPYNLAFRQSLEQIRRQNQQ